MLRLCEERLLMSDTTPNIDALCLTKEDNVATVLRAVRVGETVSVRSGGSITTIAVRSDIPICHKIAFKAIAPGHPVIKYGEVIGIAIDAIAPGRHVHIHNMRSNRART